MKQLRAEVCLVAATDPYSSLEVIESNHTEPSNKGETGEKNVHAMFHDMYVMRDRR